MTRSHRTLSRALLQTTGWLRRPLLQPLHRMSPSSSAAVWRPIVLDPADPADQGRLSDLRSGGKIRESCDTLAAQLRDWAQVRTPGRRLTGPDADVRAAELLAGPIPPTYGRWVFFPWSHRLVRVLPPAEFIEVRTNRNRNKVTAAEQEKLECLTVGIVGLSVGNAVARTLALERAAGCLKLADFDTLDLSNLNRLQAGLHELGVNKAILAARQIAELDPYLRVHVFAAGLCEANLTEFLDGGVPVSVLVDECDSLDIKLLLREQASERRLPVLMETSDRGLLDVERFDLEPTRPLFHGGVPGLDRGRLTGLSVADKVVPALEIVGLDTISPLMGASLVEIGRTLSTWPQLGGEVALGGATVAAAIRRIGLGFPLPSGRVHVDLDRVLECLRGNPDPAAPPPTATRQTSATGDGSSPVGTSAGVADVIRSSGSSILMPAAPRAGALPGSVEVYAPMLSPAQEEWIPALHQWVVEHAMLAPSGGNCQPWRFYSEGEALHLVHDRQRSINRLDVGHRAGCRAGECHAGGCHAGIRHGDHPDAASDGAGLDCHVAVSPGFQPDNGVQRRTIGDHETTSHQSAKRTGNPAYPSRNGDLV